MPASLALVTSSIASDPSSSSALRSHCEIAEPTSVCSTETSAVSRVSRSPVRVVSSAVGVSPSTRANTSRRRSAATRSPSQDTRL